MSDIFPYAVSGIMFVLIAFSYHRLSKNPGPFEVPGYWDGTGK